LFFCCLSRRWFWLDSPSKNFLWHLMTSRNQKTLFLFVFSMPSICVRASVCVWVFACFATVGSTFAPCSHLSTQSLLFHTAHTPCCYRLSVISVLWTGCADAFIRDVVVWSTPVEWLECLLAVTWLVTHCPCVVVRQNT
jgi:hypothetical protein